MSCLNLKRLLPHRKMWKVLTNKLHLKLSRSKATKKPKHRSYKTSKKISWPSLSIQPKKFKKQTLIHHKNHHCYSRRQPPPIFIDHLFIQPASLVGEHVVTPRETSKESPTSSGSSSRKREKLDPQSDSPESGNEKSGRLEPSKEETRAIKDDNVVNADDVWESMMLNSPQMNGIDERADEFIARFRAEMRQQEILAQRL